MKKFFDNLKKYWPYTVYSAVASLREEVSGSYFSWLWWILDPFMFMVVYSFVAVLVFGKTEPHFIAFVFIGHGAWTCFNRCIALSVKLIRANKSILSRVYLPKYILILSMLFENFIRYLITVALCFIVAVFDHVQFSAYLLWFPVLILCMMLFIFGACCIMTHIGVYAKDMINVVNIFLRLLFYMSGIFYNIGKQVPAPYGKILLSINPMAMYITEMRNVVLYKTAPHLGLIFIWVIISLLMAAFGIHLIHENEQSYVKAI